MTRPKLYRASVILNIDMSKPKITPGQYQRGPELVGARHLSQAIRCSSCGPGGWRRRSPSASALRRPVLPIPDSAAGDTAGRASGGADQGQQSAVALDDRHLAGAGRRVGQRLRPGLHRDVDRGQHRQDPPGLQGDLRPARPAAQAGRGLRAEAGRLPHAPGRPAVRRPGQERHLGAGQHPDHRVRQGQERPHPARVQAERAHPAAARAGWPRQRSPRC